VASVPPAHHVGCVRDLLNRLERALGDRYRVEREVGRGGMAIVYLAEDLKHHRRVAIKVLKPELVPALGTERFLREIEIAARLAHPNILPLYDSGVHGDPPLLYYVMPYVEGETLRDRLNREKALPLDEAVQIAREVAEALGYAHSLGLVHRDVKPENILFQAGHAVVSDFGIARVISQARGDLGGHLTESGIAVGTLSYMSPEQAAGKRDLDSRTDIYSLGCVLYEMLAGDVPLGPSASARSMEGPVAELRLARESVSIPLASVIAKAMARVAADRFATAAQFTEALARATGPHAAAPEVRRATRTWPRMRIAVLAGAIAVGGAASALGLWDRAFRTTAGATNSIKLAVLPFENMTGDPAQEYFSDGLTEEMITQLGRLNPQRLGVIARASIMRYKRTDKPVAQIGRELDVAYVLQGSARREGDRVRIAAQLIRVRDQTQLWADSYDREFSGILAVQSAVAQGVAGSLALALLPGEQTRLATARPVSPGAYEAYLRGREHANKLAQADLETALRYYSVALQHDSTYALAYVGIAQAWGRLQQMGFVPISVAERPARTAVSRALALDSTLGEAHYALAAIKTWTDWDWAAGEEEFRKAIALAPNVSEGRAAYAHFLELMKRPAEAALQIEQALALDPFNVMVRAFNATMLIHRRRYDEALAQERQVLATVPNMPMGLSGTQIALHLKGSFADALEAERAMWAARNDRAILAVLERGNAEARYPAAQSRVAEVLAVRARANHTAPLAVAVHYIKAGELGPAMEWLERSYEAHEPAMPYISVSPLYDPLRSDPRFQDLLRRMKLPQ
jgi:serine/threonine-protein kinase